MSIWTKEELEEQIAAYKNALLTCSQGKAYTIGSRSLTRSDMKEIKEMLDYFEEELNKLENKPSFFAVRAKLHHKLR